MKISICATLLLASSVGVAAPRGPLLAHADLVLADPPKRDQLKSVLVAAWPVAPEPGTYVLLDVRGVVARLTFDPQRTRSFGQCPHRLELAVEGTAERVPGPTDHVVVLGPLAKVGLPRLLFLGLARGGHVATAMAEPLGVEGPPGPPPTYAVDLDGDGTGDLVLTKKESSGAVVRGAFEVQHEVRVLRRDGKRWREAAKCQWTRSDHVD